MQVSGRLGTALFWLLFAYLLPVRAATGQLASCDSGARAGFPCELVFSAAGDQPATLSVEFRGPTQSTVRMEAFPSPGVGLRVRFTPPDSGDWSYRVSSSVATFEGKESRFKVAPSGNPAMLTIANLRHWRTRKREPHLWLSAEVPWLSLEPAAFSSWLDERKREGFTHVRATLLTRPNPDEAYFAAVDERALESIDRGMMLDLVLANAASESMLDERMVRYLIARYGGLNVTWQGVEQFDLRPGTRELLRRTGDWLKQYDGFQHPRSSDAAVSSSPLANDGWSNFLIDASPRPEVAAVEHEFYHQPQIHVIHATDDAAAFRKELWSATTSGAMPIVRYAALSLPENQKSLAIWKRIVSGTRYWELEPFYDISGANAAGLEEVEYLAYAPTGGIVEVTLPKHKYNPMWVNPITGDELPLKNYKGEVFSQATPDNAHDWILELPREGKKESMLRSVYFESVDAPVQEVEFDSARMPFQIDEPAGDEFNRLLPVPCRAKVTRANRGSRRMQYLWWGEVVAGGEGARLLGVGASGNLSLPAFLVKSAGSSLNLRLEALNANGKAYQLDRVYRLIP